MPTQNKKARDLGSSGINELNLVKRVKRGYQGPREPRTCGVAFEDVPAWLWGMRVSDFSSIAISRTMECRLREEFSSTWEHFQSKLTVFEDGTAGETSVDVWFHSGSQKFLDSQDWPDTDPVISWLYPAGRKKPDNIQARTTWIRIAHSQIGGVTTISGMFCVRHLIPVVVEPDPIARSIDHVLKYGERPTPCPPEWAAAHYRVTDRLSIRFLDRPVLYPSAFSRTGWGHRKLLPVELGHAFDLPPFVDWEDCLADRIVPIQLFRFVVDHALKVLPEPGTTMACCPPLTLPLPVITPSPRDNVFLDSIGKWLPGEWADGLIAARAVKSDDASVDFSPWHRRISLVLPCTSVDLHKLETLALRFWRRSLFRSFIAYLAAEYGPDWQQGFWDGCRPLDRRRLRGPALDVAEVQPSDEFAQSASKRCRRAVGHHHTRGGSELRGRSQDNGSMDRMDRMVDRVQEGPQEGPVQAKESQAGQQHDELYQDVNLGRAVLSQVLSSAWWDWSNGSSLFFWRWNGKEQRQAARDGIKIFIQSTLPTRRKIKPIRLDASQRALVSQKLEGMLNRSYLEAGFVSNALHFFAVPKGESDVRVVFDGTSSGLNETLWAPNFYLPTASAAALNLSYTSWMADMDCGEMFHNFPMDRRIRKCAGLQIGKLGPSGERGADNSLRLPTFIRWARLFMGMRPSPYLAVRHYYWAEEFAKGDPSLKSNPMGFDKVILNLPGMTTYDPTLPKVMKWNSEAGAIAGDVITFVDDIRISGFSKENCHLVHRQFASRLQYLGMQDAPRKFRPPSQNQAGAWTGTIFRISSDSISKSVSQEKWDKGVAIVCRLREAVIKQSDGRPMLDRKLLERDTGFLNHLSMTFENLIPYLKGFYLTLNSWRRGRDSDDWKLSDKQWYIMMSEKFHAGDLTERELEASMDRSDLSGAPLEVKASPRFEQDIEALSAIFGSTSDPPNVNLRSRKIITVVYGFGDASGSGLGATFTCGSGYTFRIGVWGAAEKPESSNWKEFTNVVESLEEEGRLGKLADAEVFMFTDNATVESCATRGSSSSRKLLELVIRLQSLSTRLGIRIHIFHVAGTRMIAQGTDGVSRGYLGQGVMAGENMKVHIPIFLSAAERSPHDLVPWIMGWSDANAIVLNPSGWFQSGHDVSGWSDGKDGFSRPILSESRTYIWIPPPFAADVALAELRKARIKRQSSCHVFVCPRLCTTLWQRQLFRCADFVFEVPVGSSIWPADMHEPLLIGILFPFLRVKPWQLRGTPKMHAVGRELRGLYQDKGVDPSNFLRKFWRAASVELQCMSERMVWKMLHFE